MTKIGNGPINPAYKVQRQPGQEDNRIAFDASWQAFEAPLNALVGIKAVARTRVQDAKAEIRIFQVLNGQSIAVDYLTAPCENGRVSTQWRTKAAKAGNFEAGAYHFEVRVSGYSGQTVRPLLLRNVAPNRNQDGFETAKPKPKLVF